MGSIGMKGTGYGVHWYEGNRLWGPFVRREQAMGSIGMKGTGYGVHRYEGNRLWGPLV